MSSPEYVEHVTRRYEASVKRSAQRLREAADEFERAATDLHPGRNQGQNPRTSAAARAIHALQWGVANASVESIIRDAAEADYATRGEEKRDG